MDPKKLVDRILFEARDKPLVVLLYIGLAVFSVSVLVAVLKPKYAYVGENNNVVIYVNKEIYEKDDKTVTAQVIMNDKVGTKSSVGKFYIDCVERKGGAILEVSQYSEPYGKGALMHNGKMFEIIGWNGNLEKVCNMLFW